MDKNLKGLATETWVLKKLSRLYGAGSSVNVMSGDDSLRELFNSLFEKENVGTTDEPVWVIKAKLPLYSLGEISAFGRSSGEGGGGTGGGGTWGSITGTISNQSDLIELLNTKQDAIQNLAVIINNASVGATHAGTAHAPSDAQKNVQSDWNAESGDAFIKNKPTIPTTLPASDVYPWAKAENKPSYTTSEVSEGTNKYFTDARAQSALSGHTGDTTIHITSDERTIWNATYTLLNELFAKETIDSTTVIKAKFPFYSVGEVSAFGLSSGEGGGVSISSISTDYINNLQ